MFFSYPWLFFFFSKCILQPSRLLHPSRSIYLSCPWKRLRWRKRKSRHLYSKVHYTWRSGCIWARRARISPSSNTATPLGIKYFRLRMARIAYLTYLIFGWVVNCFFFFSWLFQKPTHHVKSVPSSTPPSHHPHQTKASTASERIDEMRQATEHLMKRIEYDDFRDILPILKWVEDV